MSDSTTLSMYEMVKEFQREIVKYPLPEKPCFADEVMLVDQLQHVIEEVEETYMAITKDGLVSLADGIVDAIYVLMGIAARCGLPLDEAFKIVHAANMRKVGGVTKRGMAYDAVKPAGWVGPEAELKQLLDKE